MESVINVAEAPDEELLNAIAQERSKAAFHELFQRLQKPAFNLAYRLTGNRDAAEESVQEAMLKVWTSASTFRGEGDVKSWMLRIVARQGIKANKGMKRKSSDMERGSHRQPAQSGKSPAEQMAGAEILNALHERLNGLPVLERQMLSLHFAAGMSQQEIGEAFAIPQQTVSYKITETLKKLRASLSGAGFAAAIPLLEHDALGDAICNVLPAPPGLREKVMSSLNAARAPGMSSRPRRIAPPRTSYAMWMLGAVAAVGTGLIYVAFPSTPGATPAPVVAAGKPQAPAARNVNRRWSFKTGPDSELKVYSGKWGWNAKTRTMNAPSEVRILIPVTLSAGPARLVAKVRVIDVDKMVHSGLLLVESNVGNPIANSWTKDNKLDMVDLRLECYFVEPYVVEQVYDNIALITEYKHPHEANTFVLTLNNVAVSEIEYREITRDEVPALIRDTKSLISQLQPGIPPKEQHR
jgi:RNA polymerase sigma-70 factor, ECF subfamily